MRIRDPFKAIDGIELFMKKIEDAPTVVFRKFVRRVFREILFQTPQWSGKAVANWNVTIGSPDYSWDDDVGNKIDLHQTNVLDKGNASPWIDYALLKNEHVLDAIRRRDKVYITNAVHGDTDNGKSSELYLEALQNPAYWQEKLRAANKPYEVATETMIRVITEFKDGKFKAGAGLELFRVGGDSFDR